MDIEYVNPFIDSFENVMPQLGFSQVQRGALKLNHQLLSFSGVMIIIGIVGAIRGNVVYCIGTESAKKIASTMMMGMPVDEMDDMAKSALSELTNMLTATAATRFSENGITIDISTPTLLSGENVNVKMSSKQVLCVEMLADDTPIEINIAFEE